MRPPAAPRPGPPRRGRRTRSTAPRERSCAAQRPCATSAPRRASRVHVIRWPDASLPHGTWPSPITPGVPRHWPGFASTRCGSTAATPTGSPAARARAAAPPWCGTTAPRPRGAARALGRAHPGPRVRRRRVRRARGTVVFSHVGDDRVHRLDAGATEPTADHPAGSVALRRARPARRPRLRRARGPLPRPGARQRARAARPARRQPGGGVVLATGTDFVSRPAVSPDGRSLAWVAWGHPSMPWDSTELHRATLTARACAAGSSWPGTSVSVVQPAFGPDGALWFLSDESGWWTCTATPVTGRSPCTTPGRPRRPRRGASAWSTSPSSTPTAPWCAGGTTAAPGSGCSTPHRRGRAAGRRGVSPSTSLQAVDDEVALRRGLADRLPEVVRGPLSGVLRVLGRSGDVAARPRRRLAGRGLVVDRHRRADRARPAAPAPAGPASTGPRASCRPSSSWCTAARPAAPRRPSRPRRHFWTTRGFAVLHVNYSGSTGYGRAYRERLLGRWGLLDIDDCVTGALSLALAGRVDRDRLAIRGGSAGGYAVLRAMTTSRPSRPARASSASPTWRPWPPRRTSSSRATSTGWSRPWPEGEAVYRERSPHPPRRPAARRAAAAPGRRRHGRAARPGPRRWPRRCGPRAATSS